MNDNLPDIVARNSVDRVRSILESGVHVNQRDKKGRTALFRAARLGKSQHLSLLLEFGADPNETDKTDEAPLQSASRHGHVDCVRLLLTAGAKINHLPDPCGKGIFFR